MLAEYEGSDPWLLEGVNGEALNQALINSLWDSPDEPNQVALHTKRIAFLYGSV